VVQYVAPQLWAWRAGRLSRLREAADEVAAVLPFEEQWFGERGLPCHYVGHPASDRTWPSRAAARGQLGITSPEPVLGMFPGSRAGEIERHWPLFREVAFRLLAAGHCRQVIVAGTPAGRYPDPGPCQVHHGAPELVQAAATVLLTKSGSATLEAAIVGTPMVVVYRTSRLTYEIARRQMTVNRISLVNLIAGQDVVPEFWHPPVSAAPIAAAVQPLLDSASVEATRQRAALEQVRHRLGGRGTAVRVADLLLGRLEC
jgi:lipid-A-disaccharide synthase